MLRAPTGAFELALAEAAAGGGTRPARVTAVLVASLVRVGETNVTVELAQRLSAGTREWLLQQVASSFRPAEDWYETNCAACGQRYDLGIAIAALPRKEPGPSFPTVTVETSRGPRRFEVPNGSVEQHLAAGRRTGDAARRAILAGIGLDDDAAAFARDADATDLDRIDAALEEAAPEPPTSPAPSAPTAASRPKPAWSPLPSPSPARPTSWPNRPRGRQLPLARAPRSWRCPRPAASAISI